MFPGRCRRLCSHRFLIKRMSPFLSKHPAMDFPFKFYSCQGKVSESRDNLQGSLPTLEDDISYLEQLTGLPSTETLIQILHQCRKEKNPVYAKRLHAYMQQKNLQGDQTLANYLVSMLADCGYVQEARQALDLILDQNVYAYNALILAYTECGKPQNAVHLYQQMQANGLQPTTYTFVALLKACALLKDLAWGRQLRDEILRRGLQRDAFVGNALLGMFGKCGSVRESKEVFDLLLVRDVVSWSSMIVAYANQEDHESVVGCFTQMQSQGVMPNVVTYTCGLKSCGSINSIESGQHMYCEAVKMGFESDILVGTTTIDMFCRCDQLAEAQAVFDKLPSRNMVSWNALIAGYIEHGLGKQALALFKRMRLLEWALDDVALVCGLRACAHTGASELGQRLHTEIVMRGMEGVAILGNTLVDMLGKCGLLEDTVLVFDRLEARDVVSWSAMIMAYTQDGFEDEALHCLRNMRAEGVSPNAVVFACCLKACCNLGAAGKGQVIHDELTKHGFEKDVHIGNILVDMYGEFGLLSEAIHVFDKLSVRNLMSWSALIKGYGINHDGRMALRCFQDMLDDGVKPDAIAYTTLLVACSHTSLVPKGQEYFRMMEEEPENRRQTDYQFACMVDLLGRAGRVKEAARVLDTLECLPSKEMWKALLSACRSYGEEEIGIRCFEHLVEMNADDASSYAMMIDIYRNAGRSQGADSLEELRKLKSSQQR